MRMIRSAFWFMIGLALACMLVTASVSYAAKPSLPSPICLPDPGSPFPKC